MDIHEDYSLKVQTWMGHIRTERNTTYDGDEYVWHGGSVATPYGYVIVNADASRLPFTALSFIWQGRNYHRSWKRYYRPRYIVKLAKEFAAEIASQATSPVVGKEDA